MTKRTLSPEEYHKKRDLIPNQRLKDLANREESRLLAIMVKNKEYLERALGIDKVSYKHFIIPHHASVFVLIAKYYDDYGSLVSRDAFRTMIEESSGLVGEKLVVFNKYYNQRVSTEDYEKIIDGMKERYATQLFWEASDKGNLLAKTFQSQTGQREAIFDFYEKIGSIKTEIAGADNGYNRTLEGTEALDNLFDILQERRETTIKERGIVVGIDGFDKLFQGFRFGKYGVILGFPNGGKTTTMINFANNMANEGYKVCYVTIESDAEEIAERMLSKASQVSGDILKKGGKEEGGLTDDIMNRLLIARDKMKNGAMKNMSFVSVSQRTPIVDILAMVDRKRQFEEYDVVFFDYLDVIGHMIKNSDRKDLEIADTSQRIQAWGKENNIQVWSAQSIKNNKIQEFRKKDFMENAENASVSVGVEDVGGTQAISRDADYVIAIVPHPDGDRLIVYVTKSRYDAPAGSKFMLEWLKSTCTIEDMSDYIMSSKELMDFAQDVDNGNVEEVAEEKPSESPPAKEQIHDSRALI